MPGSAKVDASAALPSVVVRGIETESSSGSALTIEKRMQGNGEARFYPLSSVQATATLWKAAGRKRGHAMEQKVECPDAAIVYRCIRCRWKGTNPDESIDDDRWLCCPVCRGKAIPEKDVAECVEFRPQR